MFIRRKISSIKDFFLEIRTCLASLVRTLFLAALEINQDLFGIFLITYVVFLFIEEFKKGFVTYNFNLNILFYIVIVSGVLMVFSRTKKEELKILDKSQIVKKDCILITILGIIGGVLIYYKTQGLGFSSYVISIISGALIILLSISLLKEDNRNETNSYYGF